MAGFSQLLVGTAAVAAVGLLAAQASAVGPIPNATYNFNTDTPTSATGSGGYTSPGTFDLWQIQGGSDGSETITGGIDTNGTASGATPAGNALFANFGRTGGSYQYLQLTNYYANPTNTAGNAASSNEVQASFDMRVDGAEDLSSPAMQLTILQGNNQSPSYSSVIPISGLANGSYVHFDLRLDQGVQTGTFSNTASFSTLQFAVTNGGAAFGTDANNSVHLDNFVLSVVAPTPTPEPASLAVVGVAGLAVLRRRRRA